MPITIREHGEGERRWFLGGGEHVWKLASADTDGAFFLFEDFMEHGKVTPLHRHPAATETLYVLEGSIAVHLAGGEREVGTGGVAFFPKGEAHAFKVTSTAGARVLCLQTPGHDEAFYRLASEPASPSAARKVDFKRLGELAREHGAVEILGPPPFKHEPTRG